VHPTTYDGIAGPGAPGAGLLGTPGAGRMGIEGIGAWPPPGLLGRGGGGARPGFGEFGLLEKKTEK